jgi:hypothetical protein
VTPGSWPNAMSVEPAWAPVLREQAEIIANLIARIEELERRDAMNTTIIERLDQDITTLFTDVSMIRSGGDSL